MEVFLILRVFHVISGVIIILPSYSLQIGLAIRLYFYFPKVGIAICSFYYVDWFSISNYLFTFPWIDTTTKLLINFLKV